MKTILIILLGNRDLQIPVTASVSLTYRDRLLQNNDDKDFYTINKTQQASFLETSEMIWKDYENFKNVILFPMITQTIEYIKNSGSSVDKIIFCTSKQTPLDGQDCHYVAEFANKFFSEKGYNTEYLPFSCNPTNFPELLDFFLLITNQYQNDKIFFGNSGGTADMKAASYFSGVFKNIEFVTINARTKHASQNNFKKQEQAILKHIVEKMLNSFDYGGITQLPIDNQEIKKLAEYALARIALDYDSASSLANELDINELKIPTNLSIKEKEIHLFLSAKIKFKQKSYGDYLWRLFTILDNIYIPFLNDYFQTQVETLYEKKTQHQEWNRLLNQYPSLVAHLNTRTFAGNPLKWDEPNKYAYNAIFDKLVEDNLISEPQYVNNLIKNLNELAGLRNAIAHNYKGISLTSIESKLIKRITPSVDDFNNLVSDFIGVPFDNFQIYDDINQKIKELL
jgi:hypothetical protein